MSDLALLSTGLKDFVALLRTIMGGDQIDYDKAAACFCVTRTEIRRVLRGDRPLTQEIIEKEKWREKLAIAFPKAWAQEMSAFEIAALKLEKNRKQGLAPQPPSDKNSLQYVIWLILGGKNANIRQAAILLNMSICCFEKNMRGKKPFPVAALIDTNWEQIFSTHFSAAWQQHGKDFEQLKDQEILSRQKTRLPFQGPEDLQSFGGALWRVLGCDASVVPQAAKVLGLLASDLRLIILNKRKVTQQFLVLHEWDQKLATINPVAWRQNKALYQRQTNGLLLHSRQRSPRQAVLRLAPEPAPIISNRPPTCSQTKPPQSKGKTSACHWGEQQWKKAAQAFVSDVRKAKQVSFIDLARQAFSEVFKKPEMWESIETSDHILSSTLLRNAVKEISSIFELEDNRSDGFFAEGRLILFRSQHILRQKNQHNESRRDCAYT